MAGLWGRIPLTEMALFKAGALLLLALFLASGSQKAIAAGDLDEDGFSDQEETQVGSDPNDPNSTPHTVGRLLYDNHIATNDWVRSIAIDQEGRFVYAIVGNQLKTYGREMPSGALSELYTDAQVTVNNGALYIDKNRQYLYVSDRGSAQLAIFYLDEATGMPELKQIIDDSVLEGMGSIVSFTQSEEGKFYHLASSGGLYVLKRDLNGQLVLVQRVEFPSVPRSTAISRDNGVLFVTHADHVLRAYSRDSVTGTIDDTELASVAPGYQYLSGLLRWPTKDWLFVTTSTGKSYSTVKGYQWTGEGFSALTTDCWGNNYFDSGLSIAPDFNQLYIRQIHTSRISSCVLDASTGSLTTVDYVLNNGEDTAGTIVTTIGKTTSVAASLDGRHVYVGGASFITTFRHDRLFDLDGDYILDEEDLDIDGDGVDNLDDSFPYNSTRN